MLRVSLWDLCHTFTRLLPLFAPFQMLLLQHPIDRHNHLALTLSTRQQLNNVTSAVNCCFCFSFSYAIFSLVIANCLHAFSVASARTLTRKLTVNNIDTAPVECLLAACHPGRRLDIVDSLSHSRVADVGR